MIYILAFSMATLFAYFAGKVNKKYKGGIMLFSTLCILSLSVLGGLRDTSLGTDVEVYIIPHFKYAHTFHTLTGFLTHFNNNTGREPLYRTIVYMVSRFTDNVNWLLFVFQFLTAVFVFVGAYKHKENAPLPLVVLLWCLMYYNDSYNLVRQHLAMAILFSGIDNVEKGNYKRFLLFVLAASFVHTSAVLAIAFIVIHFFTATKKLSHKTYRKILLIAGITVGCLGFTQIVVIAVRVGLLPAKYLYYVNTTSVSSNNFETLLYLIEIIAVFLLSGRVKRLGSATEFYSINSFALFMLMVLSRTLFYGNRIGMYFGIINILFVAQLPKLCKNQQQRMISYAAISAICLVYWWYVYVRGGVSMTYPYVLGV